MEKQTNIVRAMFDDCLIYNEQIIFILRDMNMICSFDMKKNKTKILGKIPEESFRRYRLSTNMYIYKDKIILTPCSAKKIWVYNIQSKEWHSIAIRSFEPKYMEYKILQSVAYKEKLYMIGSNYPAVICMDMETEDIEYIEIYDHLKDEFNKYNDCFIRSDYVCIDEFLYMASCLSNEVLKFDMETKHFKWIKVGNMGNRYSGIAWDGNNFWLSPRINTPIVMWDGKEKFDEIKLPGTYNDNTYNFLGIVYFCNYIIIPGLLLNKTLYINKNNVNDVQIKDGQFTFVRSLDDNRLFGQKREGQIFVVDKSLKTEYFDIVIDVNQLREYFIEYSYSIYDFFAEGVYDENSLINLQILCDEIQQKKIMTKLNTDNGTHIWKMITKL